MKSLRALLLGSAMVLTSGMAVRASPDLPNDVGSFLQRTWQCHGLDASYRRARQDLGCDRLKADKERLEARYRDQPRVLANLNGHWVKVVTRLPARVAK